jgi:hypothetical protein
MREVKARKDGFFMRQTGGDYQVRRVLAQTGLRARVATAAWAGNLAAPAVFPRCLQGFDLAG